MKTRDGYIEEVCRELKLVLDNESWFKTMLHKYDDEEKVRVSIERERGTRTNKQISITGAWFLSISALIWENIRKTSTKYLRRGS
jgi:hypothetical protein